MRACAYLHTVGGVGKGWEIEGEGGGGICYIGS